MTATSTIDRIRQLRQDAIDAKRQIESRISETRQRIRTLCSAGIVLFDEAWPAWLEFFESYADEGRATLERSFSEHATPNDPDPITGRTRTRHGRNPFATCNDASGRPLDNGKVFAHLQRKQIIEQARAWFETTCADTDLPPADERRAELERLADQLRALEEERDDIQDELSELFRMEPSDRTKQERKQAERDDLLDGFNEPIRRQNALLPEPRSSRAKVHDSGESDDGPKVRSA